MPSCPSNQRYSSFWPRAFTRTARRRPACVNHQAQSAAANIQSAADVSRAEVGHRRRLLLLLPDRGWGPSPCNGGCRAQLTSHNAFIYHACAVKGRAVAKRRPGATRAGCCCWMLLLWCPNPTTGATQARGEPPRTLKTHPSGHTGGTCGLEGRLLHCESHAAAADGGRGGWWEDLVVRTRQHTTTTINKEKVTTGRFWVEYVMLECLKCKLHACERGHYAPQGPWCRGALVSY